MLTKTLPREAYKAGDTYIIRHLPERHGGSTWIIGAKIVLDNPPTIPIDEFIPSAKAYTESEFGLQYSRWHWIPPEWVERFACGDPVPNVCSCSMTTLMSMGCVCGHLQKETRP